MALLGPPILDHPPRPKEEVQRNPERIKNIPNMRILPVILLVRLGAKVIKKRKFEKSGTFYFPIFK